MSKKSKLLNNPLKQRYHAVHDMNFDSQGVQGTISFTQRDRVLWNTGKKTIQPEQTFNSPILTQNLDRVYLDESFSPPKVKEQEATGLLHYKRSSFRSKYAPQKPKIAMPLINRDQRAQTFQGALEGSIGKPFDRRRDYTQGYLSHRQSGDKSYSVHQQQQQNLKQIENIPATQTAYATFYEDPKIQLKKINLQKPGFYQSVLPKNLNIPYRTVVQAFEKTNFLYQKPAIIRPREYSPDGYFKKLHLLTNDKWSQRLRQQKDYI